MENRAKIVYLAGPVRALGRRAAIEIRSPLEVFFMRRGMVTFNPPGAWGAPIIGSDLIENAVKLGNDAILVMCDMVAALFFPGIESTGTDEEIRIAARHGMRILVICNVRDHVTDAIAWMNPLIGSSGMSNPIQVEFAVLRGKSDMDTISVITYDPALGEVAN